MVSRTPEIGAPERHITGTPRAQLCEAAKVIIVQNPQGKLSLDKLALVGDGTDEASWMGKMIGQPCPRGQLTVIMNLAVTQTQQGQRLFYPFVCCTHIP